MRSSRFISIAAAAALTIAAFALAAPQPTTAGPARTRTAQCFWARNVENFAYVDRQTLNIRVSGRQVYQLKMFGSCNDLDYINAIRLDTHGFSSVCDARDMDLIVPSPVGPQRCPIRSMRRLTPEEIAALPRGQRP